ncbi:hypothetical protein [Rasiella sp. SM2506]|uniref:hypothetical protein n=1 Tax=Rasiella sp. SM2506 TaxID=3423914 RepID=UPI003D7BB233
MEALTIWMILGFLLATYSVIGNDSVQTFGTFIASNNKRKWRQQWMYMSVILVGTLLYSWITNDGDISYGRLAEIPPVEIKWYYVLAPLVLFILTKKGVPASTSLLVLSAFSSSLVFEKIIFKSSIGYGLAAVSAYVLWLWLSKWDEESKPIKTKHIPYWRIFQWGAIGFLWYTWLTHGLVNIAVFLPRKLDVNILIAVAIIFVVGLGYIFKTQGGKIQEIVLSKKDTTYVRSATLIDLFYAFILLLFKEHSNIPMSTTWVFVGVLCGRELAIATRNSATYTFKNVFPIVGKDMLKLLVGLGVSILVALFFQNLTTVLNLF